METTEKINDIELMDSMPTGTHMVIIDTYEERQFDEYTYLDFQLIGLEGEALDRQIMNSMKKVQSPLKKRIYLMIEKQNQEHKVRKSTYYDLKTEQLLSQKSQELGLSKNQLSELCLQRFLPEMQSTWT